MRGKESGYIRGTGVKDCLRTGDEENKKIIESKMIRDNCGRRGITRGDGENEKKEKTRK